MSMAITASVVGIAGTAYGAYQSSQMSSMAGRAGKDPFGKQNRVFYRQRLRHLVEDPNSAFRDPAFMASQDQGLKAVQRTMAAQGFLGSGNEATALMDYSQSHALDWLKSQEELFAQLGGAQLQPSYGAAVAGQAGAMQGWNNSMGQLGSLMAQFGTSGSGLSPISITAFPMTVPGAGNAPYVPFSPLQPLGG